jgi:hypothetical protein
VKGSVRFSNYIPVRDSRGQALVETALVTPLLLLVVLNAINFGYYFLVALNLSAAPRSGVEYSILGFSTPGTLTVPAAGPSGTNTTVSYLTYQDMTGALSNPQGATVQVCSKKLGLSAAGTSNCIQCPAGSCGTANGGSPAPAADPEPSAFILQRVDVDYSFSPLIPGTPFGIALLPSSVCTSSGGTITCTFHRQVSMRAMD